MESGDQNTATPSDDESGGDAANRAGNGTNRPMPAAANASLALSIVAGVGLLVWWTVAFHPGDEQLWMVPVSLVMVGTPLMVWLSVSRTCPCSHRRRRRRELKLLFASPPDPDPEK